MSALPRAVQAQLDQAEALQAQLAAEAAPPSGNPEPAEPAPEPHLQLVEPQPQPQPTNQAPTVPDETWEQRFRIMEGKYKAEVPRLHDQIRELTDRLDQAVKSLETKPEPKPEAKKFVTDADVEQFGADLVDMARRVAREEFDILSTQLADMLDKRFGDVTAQVQRTEQQVVRSAADKFWDTVNAAHPDFEAVNNDPKWFAFLDERIPGTRLTRRQVAQTAIQEHDAQTMCEQLKLYKDGIAPPAAPAKKPDLNRQVAPSSSRAAAPAEPAKKIWSGQEYAAALDHRNLQRMSREDYDALVAEAEQALAEGRVQF